MEQKLSEVFLTEMKIAGNGISLGRRGYSLRMRMAHFVTNLNGLATESLEPAYAAFMKSFDSVKSVDELLALHGTFLEKITKEVLLLFTLKIDNQTFGEEKSSALSSGGFATQTTTVLLFTSVTKVLSTCVLFSSAVGEFIQRFSGAADNRRALQSMVNSPHYLRMIEKFERIFDKQLQTLTGYARTLSQATHGHFVEGLLTRLEFNEYYLNSSPDA